ncbi:MAG: rRNA maturation RNase YbeY [bacterium]|nr:MAG: rRNA maturation RNase YbeY [bacterium]
MEFNALVPLMCEVASRFTPKEAPVELNLVGERRMAELNRAYRGRRGATEILTFDYTDTKTTPPDPGNPIGEIYLCWRKITGNARAKGVSNRDYLLRLLVHGLCHLQGYQHGDEISAARMEAIEKNHLSSFLSKRRMALLFT